MQVDAFFQLHMLLERCNMAETDIYICSLCPELVNKAELELNEKAQWRERDVQALRDMVLANQGKRLYFTSLIMCIIGCFIYFLAKIWILLENNCFR